MITPTLFNFINSEAVETRHALHGVKWPEHNLKTLNVEFSTVEEMAKVIGATLGERIKLASDSREGEEVKPQEKSFGWSKADAIAEDRSRVNFAICFITSVLFNLLLSIVDFTSSARMGCWQEGGN